MPGKVLCCWLPSFPSYLVAVAVSSFAECGNVGNLDGPRPPRSPGTRRDVAFLAQSPLNRVRGKKVSTAPLLYPAVGSRMLRAVRPWNQLAHLPERSRQPSALPGIGVSQALPRIRGSGGGGGCGGERHWRPRSSSLPHSG